MAHSPSELWNLADKFSWIRVDECIGFRKHNNTRRVVLQLSIDGERHHHETIVRNPLAMLQVISEFKALRDKLWAEQMRGKLAEEQAKIMKDFLEKQRAEIARLHREKVEKEEQRMERAVKHVRGPIQAILARVKPVLDPYSYTNVYGRPAEVSFN